MKIMNCHTKAYVVLLTYIVTTRLAGIGYFRLADEDKPMWIIGALALLAIVIFAGMRPKAERRLERRQDLRHWDWD